MGALFDRLQSIFPVIIAVCFIGVRIFSAVKRQNKKREQAQDRDAAQDEQEISRGFRPWEDDAVDEKDDDEFSAWDLLVQDTPPAPNPAVKPAAPKPVSLFTPLQSAPLSQSTAPVLLSYPIQTNPPVQPAPPVPADNSTRAEPDTPPTRQGRTGGGASLRRIHTLPAMQQAVAWAEILGPPKGF
jgi:hypothetical protein